MASRIKGITVEIGGDTTGLEKALKNVNSSIKQTQSALKDVEKLLKLDPSNTELLTQKQKLLKDAIASTSEKLNTLKEAQQQAKEQLENGDLGQDKYDALQREIIETEQELRRLQEEAATTSTTLAKIEEVGVKLESVGDSISGAGEKLIAVTAGVVALGTAAVSTAAEFDAAMSQVAAVSGAAGDELEALTEKAREMGEKTKFSASEAAEAMNYMAMAGWKTEDMLNGIEGIMNLAAASGEDLATTSDIVTDALTAFGLTAADSGHFADILAAASSNANTNVSMMGETFKYAAPVAGALGYSVEDVAEAIGLMANSGIKSTQAGTALRTMLTSLQGEIKLTGQNLGEVTIQTSNADGSMRGLGDILGDLRDAFSQMTEAEASATAEALVGKNAMSGFLAVMQAAPADIEKLNSAIANCDGTAEEMAAIMQDNLTGQLTILKSQLEELAISFGEVLMPVIRNVVTKIQAFVDKLNGMDDAQRAQIIRIAAVVAAIGPFLIILGKTISGIGSTMIGFSTLSKGLSKLIVKLTAGTGTLATFGSTIAAAAGPILAIVAAIAVLVAAFKHLWNTNDEFRENILSSWEKIKETVSNFCQGIVDRLNSLGFEFSSITDVIKAVWDGFCNYLAPLFESAFSIISTVLSTVLNHILNVVDLFISVFHGDWDSAWQAVKNIFANLWEGILSVLSVILETMRGVLNAVLSWFGISWEETWTRIKDFFVNIWTGIKDFFVNTWSAIKDTLSNTVDGIKTKISTVFSGVKTAVSDIFNSVKDNVSTTWKNIKASIVTPIEEAKDKVKAVVDAIKGFFSGLKLELPHIKLPHFSISGTLSISPPSVPTMSIDWYKTGGIMTKPTVFGMNGLSLMAGGEAGAEAILPLSEFYTKLETMLINRMNTAGMEKYLAVIAANSGKSIYLDDGTLVGRLLPAIDSELGKTEKLSRRLAL